MEKVGNLFHRMLPIMGVVFLASLLGGPRVPRAVALSGPDILRISTSNSGIQGNGASYPTQVSPDGSFIVFYSYASTLVANDTNNGCNIYGMPGTGTQNCSDVFLYERATGNITRVSVASDGSQGNGGSTAASISENGRYIAFESHATDLVAGDTNNSCDWNRDGIADNCRDVFVRDRQTGQTTRVSVGPDGTQGNSFSYGASMSADGRYVAFTSTATNWVPGLAAGSYEVYVHDMMSGHTTLVSENSDGTAGTGADASISADGRFIAYQGDLELPVPLSGILVYDQQTGQTAVASVSNDGAAVNGWVGTPAISLTGRFVAFQSNATNLVAGDTNGMADIFVHDMQTGQTDRVSVASDGAQGNDWSGVADFPTPVSADGRYVAFMSLASNLVSGDTNGTWDAFIHDRLTGQTTRVSVGTGGIQGDGAGATPFISADGRFVEEFEVSIDLGNQRIVRQHDLDLLQQQIEALVPVAERVAGRRFSEKRFTEVIRNARQAGGVAPGPAGWPLRGPDRGA